jgi:hypothetical protein
LGNKQDYLIYYYLHAHPSSRAPRLLSLPLTVLLELLAYYLQLSPPLTVLLHLRGIGGRRNGILVERIGRQADGRHARANEQGLGKAEGHCGRVQEKCRSNKGLVGVISIAATQGITKTHRSDSRSKIEIAGCCGGDSIKREEFDCS